MRVSVFVLTAFLR